MQINPSPPRENFRTALKHFYGVWPLSLGCPGGTTDVSRWQAERSHRTATIIPTSPGGASELNRNDSVKKNFNHRWTQINTDEETSERRSGPDFRRSLNDALYVVLEYHVFHLCPSVVKKSFTAWIRLNYLFRHCRSHAA